MREMIHLAFCFNGAFAPVASVAVSSALRKTTGPVTVHVLSADLPDAAAAVLRRLVTAFPGAELDVAAVDASRFSQVAITIPYISRETYFRFLLPELLPDARRVIYLDADLVVRGDLRALWEMDLHGAALAGAPDAWVENYGDYRTRVMGLSPGDPVVNAGVLLFDLDAMRRERLGEKCLEAMADLVPKVEYQDQDVINIVCRGRIAVFSNLWNFTMCDWDRYKRSRRRAKIVHFTGKDKPWNEERPFPRAKAKRFWTEAAARARYVCEKGRPGGAGLELKLLMARIAGGAA